LQAHTTQLIACIVMDHHDGVLIKKLARAIERLVLSAEALHADALINMPILTQHGDWIAIDDSIAHRFTPD
jgi:uncharacterized protein YbjQ (UPF0145 family)